MLNLCTKTEVNPVSFLVTRKGSPHIEWCIGKYPGLCKLVCKTSKAYLKCMLYHGIIIALEALILFQRKSFSSFKQPYKCVWDHRRHPQFFIPLHSIHTVGNLTSKISFSWICMTNLLPIKSHVTIKYSSISMTSYRDFLTKNRKCRDVRLGQGPWPVARIAQLVEQRTDVPRVVGSSPKLTVYSPNVTLLVSEVIRIIYLKHQHETPQTVNAE